MHLRALLAVPLILVACRGETPTESTGATALKVEAPRWSSVQIDAHARASLSASSLAAVDASPVPVLVPRSLASSVTVLSDAAWASFTVRRDGVTLSLHGTNVAHVHDEIAPMQGDRLVRGTPGFVTENEAIWSATWKEHGVDYALELECDTPTDARCADDKELVRWLDELVVVGGRGVQP